MDVAVGLEDDLDRNCCLPGVERASPCSDEFGRGGVGLFGCFGGLGVGGEGFGIAWDEDAGDCALDFWHGAGAAGVGEDDDGDTFLRINAHDGADAGHASAVTKNFHAVVVETSKKTERVERAAGAHFGDALVHEVDGFVGEDGLLAGEVIFQVKHGEANEVMRAGINRRGTEMVEGVKRKRV